MKFSTFIKSLIIRILLFVFFILQLIGCSVTEKRSESTDIIIENAEMKLILGHNGMAKSLIHKATGQECLEVTKQIPFFSITQYRPYDNEVMLAYPARETRFAADSVYRDGDDLIVSFELTDYEAIVGLNITDNYIGFTLKKLEYHMADFGVKRKTNIDEFTIMQLPVKDRDHFGSWLNVVWDEKVAVNLLATDPYARIDGENRDGYKLLKADAVSEVKLQGVGVALIVTGNEKLLDNIDQLEHDFNLPLGVEARRSNEYKNSYYELRDVTTKNIDEHIAFARKGGFHQMVIYYPDFAVSMGHFPWKSEYPNGMNDLQEITRKIHEAGMIVGFHIHYNKAQINDSYVTPIPDSRLNLRRMFTLSEDLNKKQTIISVEENPTGCTLEDGRRILKIGNELVSYENFTTTYPYQFTGCQRGALKTTIVNREKGDVIGLLDVDTWPIFVRFNQKTNIQKEVAAKLGEIYNKAGFQFIYFDGSEDAPRPYWFNIQWSKLIAYNAFKPAPVFCEGAVKAHFCWHIQSRGNAFDTFRPEVVKKATRKHPAAEAKFLSNDFTSLNFGWIDYVAPGDKTIGMQPDMFEYITSRAAAWDCPIAMLGKLEPLENHPRTADNLEVIRRWEEVRVTGFLSKEQKDCLKDLDQEHILLINEEGDFELVPYKQITNIAGGNNDIRAFVFSRKNKPWVVYWHVSGEGNMKLDTKPDNIELFKEIGESIPVVDSQNKTIIPVGDRRYIQFNLSQEEVIDLFSKAEIQ
jgi:hypothetical protein